MQLHCQFIGEQGEPVLLLHGLFGQGGNLMSVARALQPQFRCLLPDLRNHGRSPHSEQMDYSALADDLGVLLDAQSIRSAHLLGHSMGGKVAMQFALQHPGRAASLLVADIAPVAYPPHHQAIIAALEDIRQRQPGSRRDAQQRLDVATGDSGVSAFLLMNWTRRDGERFDWRFNLDALSAGYADISRAPCGPPYDGPVLFIKGETSDYIKPEYRGATLALFPQARMKVIADTGHWLHAEKPAIFNRLAVDFFTTQMGRGAAPGS